MALNSVYNQFADADKNDLKRKLAECQKELEEAREQIRQRRDEVNEVCKESRDSMHEVNLVLRRGENTGLHLSKEQVNELIGHMCNAHNVLNEIIDSAESGSEIESDDEGEE